MRERGWRVRMVIPPWGMASTEDRNGWSCRRWQWAGDKCPASLTSLGWSPRVTEEFQAETHDRVLILVLVSRHCRKRT